MKDSLFYCVADYSTHSHQEEKIHIFNALQRPTAERVKSSESKETNEKKERNTNHIDRIWRIWTQRNSIEINRVVEYLLCWTEENIHTQHPSIQTVNILNERPTTLSHFAHSPTKWKEIESQSSNHRDCNIVTNIQIYLLINTKTVCVCGLVFLFLGRCSNS